jgi:hypothetical protein
MRFVARAAFGSASNASSIEPRTPSLRRHFDQARRESAENVATSAGVHGGLWVADHPQFVQGELENLEIVGVMVDPRPRRCRLVQITVTNPDGTTSQQFVTVCTIN